MCAVLYCFNCPFFDIQQLNAATPVSICTELLSLERYYEYVAYAFIAYPALLFQDPCLDVLKAVTNGRLVVELCRDIVSEIHTCDALMQIRDECICGQVFFECCMFLPFVHFSLCFLS